MTYLFQKLSKELFNIFWNVQELICFKNCPMTYLTYFGMSKDLFVPKNCPMTYLTCFGMVKDLFVPKKKSKDLIIPNKKVHWFLLYFSLNLTKSITIYTKHMVLF